MVSVCQICKEPIWNFFCPDCLARDISNWLPNNLRKRFLEFHRNFVRYFNNPGSAFNWCLNCKSLREASICPYCYTNEVIYWLKSQSPALAHRFSQMFPFDFEKIGHREFFKTNNEPIADVTPSRKQFGLCDICGEYSDELIFIDGQWVCEKCRD